MIIIPTVFEKEFRRAVERMETVAQHSMWMQIDVIDGRFTDGKTFELEQLNSQEIVNKDWLFDIHLMVETPEKWVNKAIMVGGSRVIGQVETMQSVDAFIEKTKEYGVEVGLGFDIETEIIEIPAGVDVILLMARKAGFESKELDERIWEKIKKTKKWGVKIGVDGGIKKEHVVRLEEAGVSIAYVGEEYLNIVND
jgi:ribulose-phosphate 3-epimerase